VGRHDVERSADVERHEVERFADGVPVPGRVLVLGSGAREHVLAWRLARDPGIERVLVAPGNAGHSDVAEVHPEVRAEDAAAVARLVREHEVGLVVVGPEAPLVAGIADRLADEGIPVFGPTAAAARLEGSKAFCREVAAEAGVEMAGGEVFETVGPALAYAERLGAPLVVKADGLAAGKGVTVCETLGEAEAALRDAMERRVFGEAGARVVVERALRGPEASLIAICDSTTALALAPARDHKRVFDGARGPNTGGMGAYSPIPDLGEDACRDLVARIHRPVLAAMAARGTPFRGALYAGLMLTADGPRLLEFNVRFGDPEAQVILPRLDVPLAPLLHAAATDRLSAAAAELGVAGPAAGSGATGLLPVTSGAAVGVVLAAEGYPGAVASGDAIEGIAEARAAGALVFEAGTARRMDGTPETRGGRVLTVVGRGPDGASAAREAYRAAELVRFRGRQYRTDIGRSQA
jgi:phosphoribosylamine--glycine ligase